LNFAVAIDYTASNRAMNDPMSLHNLRSFNSYQQAIMQVGAILEPYDHKRNFPTFGFGGVPMYIQPPQLSHCFPLNGNVQNPAIHTIQQILATY